jgi:hypothetical protein
MALSKSVRGFLVDAATHVANSANWVFAIVVTMSVVSSFSSIRYLSGLNDSLDDAYEKDFRGQTYAQTAYSTLLAIESGAKDLVLADTAETRGAAVGMLRSETLAFHSLVSKVTPTFDARKYKALIAKTKADEAAFAAVMGKKLGPGAQAAPDAASARELLATIRPASTALKGDLIKLNDIKRASNLAWFRSVRTQLKVSLFTTIVIFAISVCVRVFLYRGKKRGQRQGRGA